MSKSERHNRESDHESDRQLLLFILSRFGGLIFPAAVLLAYALGWLLAGVH